MGNFEKLGVLVIIMLVVVILVLTVWGVGQPVDELGATLTPKQLAAAGENGQSSGPRHNASAEQPANEVPRASRPGVSPWADPDPEDRNSADSPKSDNEDTPAPIPVRSKDIIHTVVEGDSFYGMALRYYRDGTKFLVIREANPDVDPQTLSVGTRITVPDPARVLKADRVRRAEDVLPAPRPMSNSGSRTYVVRKGDSLWRIARETLGQGTDFPKILDANRDLLGDNGDDLQVGMTLVIPR